MAWDIPLYNRASLVTGPRSKPRCFSWVLLLAALAISEPQMALAQEAPYAAKDLKLKAELRPFTTAEIRTLQHLIDQAKQRVDPEYYLSEEYLHEIYADPNIRRRQFTHQRKWEQVALERRKLRDERALEREASRQRIKKLREQERNIQRIQREAQIAYHRQEFCARVQRRARHNLRTRFSNHTGYRTHPRCL